MFILSANAVLAEILLNSLMFVEVM